MIERPKAVGVSYSSNANFVTKSPLMAHTAQLLLKLLRVPFEVPQDPVIRSHEQGGNIHQQPPKLPDCQQADIAPISDSFHFLRKLNMSVRASL
jgi:hypothetical protein